MPVDVKAPQDLIDALPQEAVTGEVLRGRGPRRGNLEDLLRYWRPIMRKPGGFRRCLVILADHPELYPLENLCAWLHHETTGKWPNEKSDWTVRRVSNVTARTNTVAPRRVNLREAREIKSIIYQPIAGRQNLVDFKVNRFLEGAASTLLPGEAHPFRVSPTRQAAYSLLFGDGLGPRIGGPRGGVGVGASSRNPYRCPPGFERGGRFTNRFLSTCGQQLLSIPGAEVTPELRREALSRTNISGETIKPSTSIETSAVREARLAQIRGAVPPKVTRPNPGKKNTAVNQVLAAMNKAKTDKPLARVVRQDGTILSPLAPVSKLAAQRDNEDLLGSSYLTRVKNPVASTGVEELSLFGAGVRQLGFALPGNVRATLTASNKLSGRDIAVLRGRAASLARGSDFPMAALAELAGNSNLVNFSAEVVGMSEPNKKLRVQNEAGVSKVVPRWLFLLFLSETAPHRPSGKKPFKIVEEVGGPTAGKADASYEAAQYKVVKFLSPPLVEAKSEQRWGPLEYTASPIPQTRDETYFRLVDYKAAAWLSNVDEANDVYSEKRANVVWDPKLGRYRCPPGTRNGGRITNRMGAGCGGSILRRVIGAARRVANVADEAADVRAQTRMQRVEDRNVDRVPRRAVREARQEARQRQQEVGNQVRQQAAQVEAAREANAPDIEYAKKLNAFARGLARLAERVDVDVEQSENIVDIAPRIDLGIDEADLVPERRRRLALVGDRMNNLVNRWADAVDVDLERSVNEVDIAPRTRGRRDVDIPGARRERERQGIARRERQINRRNRLEAFANRLDPDAEDDAVLSLGGRLRNPMRRRIRSLLSVDYNKLNARQKGRVLRAAEAEWTDLNDWWGKRLNRPDFTFRDIQRYVKGREGDSDLNPDILEHIRQQRDDWGELRPIFEPINDVPMDDDEIADALNRLGPDRWGRIHLDANPEQTNQGVVDAVISRDRQLGRMADDEKKFIAEIEAFDNKAKAGNITADEVRRFISRGQDYQRAANNAQRRLNEANRAPKIDLDADPRGAVRQELAIELDRKRVDGLKALVERHNAVRLRHKDQMNRILGGALPAEADLKVVPPQPFLPGAIFNEPRPELPAVLGQIGRLDAAGMPQPRAIVNPEIDTAEKAANFVKQGGSLDEVPNEWWRDAIRANASSAEEDTTKKFRSIAKVGGAIGDTEIYVLRGPDGRRTEKGWVFKAASTRDNVGEQIAYALASAAGFQYDVAGWDGKSRSRGGQYVVLPYIGNVAQDGKLRGPGGGANFNPETFAQLPDKAYPQRLAHLLHNFTLAVADRHYQNGFGFLMDGKPFAVPIDLGWAGVDAHADTLDKYVDPRVHRHGFNIDKGLLDGIRTHLGRLTESEATDQARQIISAYDTYVGNMARIRNWNKGDFIDAQLAGSSGRTFPEFRGRAEELYDLVTQRVAHLEDERDAFFSKYIPANILDRIIAEDSPPAPAASFLVPDTEVKVNSGLVDVDGAVAHLAGGGDLNEVPANLIPQAIMRVGSLKGVNGKDINPDVILNNGDDLLDWRDEVGAQFQFGNDRFNFTYIKPNMDKKADPNRLPGPWDVFEVVDTNTGKHYFFKAGAAGIVEGLNEVVGQDIARLVGFDADDIGGGIKLGPADPDLGWRWMLIPHVADINKVENRHERWQDLNRRNANMPGPGQLKMNPDDIARIGVMDYLMNNLDRNPGNIKVWGSDGDMRVAPFDHAFAGIGPHGPDVDPMDAARAVAKMTPYEYYDQEPGNPFGILFNANRRLWVEAQREQIAQKIEEIVANMTDARLNDLFDPDRLGRHGVEWSATELQHLEAIKLIFGARLEQLRNDPRLMMAAFEKQVD